MMQRVFSLALRSASPHSRYIAAALHPTVLVPVRFYASSPWSPQHLPPRPKPPPEDEIEEAFVKGSGPGGQKINKTNSAVQLKHLPTGIVVKSQATRSRSQNRAIARNLLAQRLDELRNGQSARSAVVSDVKKKKRASSDKKSRRKYRKLEEERLKEKCQEEAGGDVVEEAVGEDAVGVSLDESMNLSSETPTEPKQ